eukprot:457956-Amorphochlora_amoeboformis.AAC.1
MERAKQGEQMQVDHQHSMQTLQEDGMQKGEDAMDSNHFLKGQANMKLSGNLIMDSASSYPIVEPDIHTDPELDTLTEAQAQAHTESQAVVSVAGNRDEGLSQGRGGEGSEVGASGWGSIWGANLQGSGQGEVWSKVRSTSARSLSLSFDPRHQDWGDEVPSDKLIDDGVKDAQESMDGRKTPVYSAMQTVARIPNQSNTRCINTICYNSIYS